MRIVGFIAFFLVLVFEDHARPAGPETKRKQEQNISTFECALLFHVTQVDDVAASHAR